MYRYVQETEKSSWIPVRTANLDSTLAELNPKKMTILEVTELVEGAREKTSYSYKGPLYFDIDCKEDVGLALQSGAELCDKLFALGLPKTGAQIFISGAKGLHVLVDQKFFSSGRPIKALPLVYKEMAKELYVPGMDFAVYSCGKGNSWRRVNMERADGNFRVPVLYDELRDLTVEQYRELASKPRELAPVIAKPEKLAYLATLFEDCRKVATTPQATQIPVTDLDLKEIKDETPPCVDAMVKFSGIRSEKNFNQVALQVAVYLARSGVTPEKADSMLSLLAENGTSSKYATLRSRVEHAKGQYHYAKNSNYTFGCNSMRALLDKSPCSGCPIEDSGASQSSTSAAGGLIERDDGYYILGTKEDRVVSNFVLKPTDVYLEIPQDGSRPRRVGTRMEVMQTHEAVTSLIFDESSWISRTGMIREMEGFSNLVFYGSDIEVQKIKHHVLDKDYDMGEIYRVHTSGILLDRISNSEVYTYVEPGMSINSNKVQGTHEFIGKLVAKPYFSDAEICPKGDEDADDALSALLSINRPLEIAMVAGWCCACHLKTQLMSSYHQFPVLSIWGGAGAGKSVTASLVTWLNGTDYMTRDTAVNVANITEFAIREYAASTTTIPRILEEYNKSKMRMSTYKVVGETLKASWNGERVLRGTIGSGGSGSRTGATLSEIPISSPMLVISEQELDMPALVERSLRVRLSKDSRKGRQEALKVASRGRESLRKIGKAMMATALQTSTKDIEDLMDSLECKLSYDIDDRPRYSNLVAYLGLVFMRKVVANSLNLPKSLKKIDSLLVDMDTHFSEMGEKAAELTVRSEVDQVLEDMSLMAALTGPSGSKYWLESGEHYILDREKGFLWIYLPIAHALYKKYYASVNKNSATIDSGKQLAKLIGDETYYDGNERMDVDGKSVVLTRLRIEEIELKSVDISHFTNM
jgi:hypothetical protein